MSDKFFYTILGTPRDWPTILSGKHPIEYDTVATSDQEAKNAFVRMLQDAGEKDYRLYALEIVKRQPYTAWLAANRCDTCGQSYAACRCVECKRCGRVRCACGV